MKLITIFLSIMLVSAAPASKENDNRDSEVSSSANKVVPYCENFQKIMKDATNGFNDGKGERHEEDGFLGKVVYWDYTYNAWDADEAIVNHEPTFESYALILKYCTGNTLVYAKQCHARMLNNLKECLPGEYYQEKDSDEDYEAYAFYRDERDKESFFPDYPIVELKVDKDGDGYTVLMTIRTF
jgi:hypothetical protein